MTHRPVDVSDIRSDTVSTLAPSQGDAQKSARSFDRRNLGWAAPVIPWFWFLIRSIHPIMDWVAIGLPVIIIVSALIALYAAVSRVSTLWLTVFASLFVLFLVAVIGPWRPTNGPPPTESIRIATVNAGLSWFSDNDFGFLVFQQEPDLVIGVELSESHDEELKSRFEFSETDIIPLSRQQQNEIALQPEGETYRRNGLPSIGVYSDLEMTLLSDPIAERVAGGLPGFRLQVETESGPMIVYALHIPRPINGDGTYQLPVTRHIEMVNAVADAVDAETLPTIIAGDLNTVDRGQGYRRLTKNLNDGMRHSGWAVPTADRPLPFSLLFARIDHLLMTPDLCTTNASSIDTRYADHRPLLADIGPCAVG